MPFDSARRWWQICRVIQRMAVEDGALPSSAEIAKRMRLHPAWLIKYLRAMRDDGLVRLSGNGPEAGWMLTAEGERWRGVEMPALRVDVPRRYVRSNPWRLRAWRRVQARRARLDAASVFDSGDEGEEIEL